MSNPLSTIERALELARSGRFSRVHDIRRQLEKEGYAGVMLHLSGVSIGRQLKGLMAEAQQAQAQQDETQPSEPQQAGAIASPGGTSAA